VRGAVAHERVEPEVGERSGDHTGGHGVGRHGAGGVVQRAVEQLVGHNLPARIEDRLAGHDDAGSRHVGLWVVENGHLLWSCESAPALDT